MNIHLTKEKIMSSALKSTIKRDNVFISEDLVKDDLTFPINGKSVFLSSIKKRKFDKKKSKLLFQQKAFETG